MNMLGTKEVVDQYRKFVNLYPEHKQAIRLDFLPFERYKVYEEWKPDSVKVLFLAEAPSWHKEPSGEFRYFYNPSSEIQGLSKFIPEYLGIPKSPKMEMLHQFKRREFFLIDTIKCILDKRKAKRIPRELIEFSAREILEREIESLKPKCILVLGRTALKGLKFIEKFSSALSRFESIREACGRSVKVEGATIIFGVFPSNRNRNYEDCTKSAFRQASGCR